MIGFGGTLYRFYPDIRADHRTGMYADRDYNFAFIHRAPIALISHPVFLNRVHKTNLGKVERGVMETVKWFNFMYKKNNMPRGKMMSILGLRTISLSIRKILAKLNAKKVTKVYTKLLRFALRIKNGA